MQVPLPVSDTTELAPAVFQAVVTAGLAAFAVVLYLRLPQRWVAWWAAAWALYTVRLGAIILYLSTGNLLWLYSHQVVTGWVALAILWAALVFSRDTTWRPEYALYGVIPVAWAWIAIHKLDKFMLVAAPTVVLIAGVTFWTGWLFRRHAQNNDSPGARFVAISFLLWGLHHLDYPILRDRGGWQPWGYFLDITFELAVGIGFGVMVLSELASRLAARTEELGHLSALMVQQHEAERSRLSRDLHDETAQTLSAVKLEIGMLREGSDQFTHDRLDHVLHLVDGGIRGIRRVMNDLRPALLDDLGLVPAIRSLADDVRLRGTLQVETDLAEEIPRLGPVAELALFRAAQEALVNVVRHASASHVLMRLRVEGTRLRLTVRDDGRGFSPDITKWERDRHLGLAGMRERIHALGGQVAVVAAAPSGTLVTVELPIIEG